MKQERKVRRVAIAPHARTVVFRLILTKLPASRKLLYVLLRTHCGRRMRFRNSLEGNALVVRYTVPRFWLLPFGIGPVVGLLQVQPAVVKDHSSLSAI